MSIPRPLVEGTWDALGHGVGVDRELEEDEVDEEVDEEEREGKVGAGLNGLSSSSMSMMEGSPGGTGVQGCQPGATEQDFTSWGRISLLLGREALLALGF